MITILAIGKKHEAWVQAGIERYEKRLKRPCDVKWILLPHSSQDGARARQEESERLLSRLHDQDYVLLLDEQGLEQTSPVLAQHIDELHANGRKLTFVIGGAYGVSDALRERADFTWSLSSLVFPHQLVRLILIEQLYRAQSISAGQPYHHD